MANFNTSHVTVYLSTVSPLLVPQFYFNTSHVTVYRHWTVKDGTWKEISIHLMLLFILLIFGFVNLDRIFQYISCYCLS